MNGPYALRSMTRGFYVGRFQPYHKGHHSVIKEIMETLDELVIGIGSADKSHTRRNPFTAGERYMMIHRAVEDLSIPVHLVPIEDIDRNALWVSHVRSLCPPFDVAISNNPLVIQLFQDTGIEVQEGPIFDRSRYQGTRIRELMIQQEDWEHLVPAPAVEAIHEVGGVTRLRQVVESDEFNG